MPGSRPNTCARRPWRGARGTDLRAFPRDTSIGAGSLRRERSLAAVTGVRGSVLEGS